MKSLPFLITLAAFAGLGVFAQNAGKPYQWDAPARAAKKQNPVAASAASLARGKTIYVKECAACHGTSGKGDGPQAATLTPKPRDVSVPEIQKQSDGSLFWKFTTGKAPMPAYDKLAEEDRWSLINYMRSLKK
jgi:mono/diheme cytochrome c family protein